MSSIRLFLLWSYPAPRPLLDDHFLDVCFVFNFVTKLQIKLNLKAFSLPLSLQVRSEI